MQKNGTGMVYSLVAYLEKYYGGRGNRKRFAQGNNVTVQQVTDWIRHGYVVVDHTLYSKRRSVVRVDETKAK